MENTFRYEKQRLYAEVSAEMLPKAVSLIKSYLTSRLYSDKERQENITDFVDRTLKSMPRGVASGVNLNKLATIRAIGIQNYERIARGIESVPETGPYEGQINITKGYRPANVAELKIETNGEGKYSIKLYFHNNCGDETRPLRWMQYAALLEKAKEAGFGSERGLLDSEVEAFKADDSSYFRTGPIDEVMSAFEWSELEAVVNFLWPKDLPDDMKRKLER